MERCRGDDRALVGQALIRAGRLIRLIRRTVICGHGAVQTLQARERGASAAPFCLLNYKPTGSNSTPQLTALMRRVMVIQPVRCKPFGPALSGEIRKPPCGVRPFQVGWGGGGFRAAVFAGVANKNSAAVFQRRAHLPSRKGAHLAPSRSGRLRGGCLHLLSRP